MDLKLFDLPTDEIYKDVFQPSMQKVGEALSTVLNTANLILLPLKLINEKSRIYFKDNIKRYSEKIEKKDLTIIPVPEIVGLPILDKLTYINQKELSETFLNLLTKATFKETIDLVHPAFLNILNNLSAEEAKILFFYKDTERIPYIELYVHKYKKPPSFMSESRVKTKKELQEEITYSFEERNDTYIRYASNLTGIEKRVDLIFPKNIDIYIENLQHNGLIFFETDLININDLDIYKRLKEEDYKEICDELENTLSEWKNEDYNYEIDIKKRSIQFTELGKSFIKACINE